MTSHPSYPLVAVDIGNSRIKLGLFEEPPADGLPVPQRSLSLSDWDAAHVEAWLSGSPHGRGSSEHSASVGSSPSKRYHWRICSVNRPLAVKASEWLSGRTDCDQRLLTAADLPLVVSVERPDLVGMDRLVNAVAANRLRQAGRAAIVIDVGSAITVDLVSPSGAFEGGAILPGIAMSARAMHDFTDLLPLIPMSELGVPPAPLGTATIPAMRSGLFWGAVGAMRELVARLGSGLTSPQIFLTGGAAATVASLLGSDDGRGAEYVPHLTLGGIALSGPSS